MLSPRRPLISSPQSPVRRSDGSPERLVDRDVPRQVGVGGGSVDGKATQEQGCMQIIHNELFYRVVTVTEDLLLTSNWELC